jgi:hypothetical protein
LHCGHNVITEGAYETGEAGGAGGAGGLATKPYMKRINATSMIRAPKGNRVIANRKPKMPRNIEPTTVPGLNCHSLTQKKLRKLINVARNGCLCN